MPKITFNGADIYIPGVYSREEVISFLAGASGTFQVPMLLGASDVGYPYHFDGVYYPTAESRRGPFTWCGTSGALQKVFGADSDLATMFKYAKRHGLPGAFVACLGKLTRATVIARSVGPVAEFTVYSQLFGAVGGHTKIKYTAGNVMTLQPVSRHSMLTANTTALSKRVYVRDNSWVSVGMALEIGSNTVANAGKVVTAVGTELNSTGQTLYYIDFSAAVGGIYTTADYGMICQYDATEAVVSGTLTAGQDVVDFVNNARHRGEKFLGVKKESTYTGALLIAVASSTPIKEIAAWAAPVPGTSPAPTSTDYTDFLTAMDASDWDTFLLNQGQIPRLFYVGDSSSTIHGLMRDWALTKRAENYPVAIVTGCAWGDVVIASGTDTDPAYRARNLNSQDVQIVANGAEGKASYLSFGPAVWGMRAAGGPWHNLTSDPLTLSNWETRWDERNDGELTLLHRYGVTTNRLQTDNSGSRYVVSQGLSTLQNNAVAWNTGTNDTPLTSQRDVADFVIREKRFIITATQLGADEVDRNSIAACLVRKTDDLMKSGYLKDYAIQSIDLNATGTGFDVTDSDWYPTTNDFVTLTTQIVIGEE